MSSPAREKHREIESRPDGRKWFDMLETLSFACPLHDTHDLDGEGQSYEDEVERCKDMVRRPGERECLEALKGLISACREYGPDGRCSDGWRDGELAERHAWAPFRERLREAEAAVADAMRCEACGGHPDDDWTEWGCWTCGLEVCARCMATHLCPEERRDQRDIELARENAAKGKGRR